MTEGHQEWLTVQECPHFKKGFFNPCPRASEPEAPCGGNCRPNGSWGRPGCEHYICGSLEMVLGEYNYNGYKDVEKDFEIKEVETYKGERITVVVLTEAGKKKYQGYKKMEMASDESGQIYLPMVGKPGIYHLNREFPPGAKEIIKDIFEILRNK